MRKLLPIFAALALIALPPATAGAYVPPGFIGVSPQSTLTGGDFELMQEAGVRSVRLPMFWSSIQQENPSVEEPNWAGFDRAGRPSCGTRIRVFPFVWGTPPGWRRAPARNRSKPPGSAGGGPRSCAPPWSATGPKGSFWEENPELPFMPIRNWEIWNEENLVTFSHNPDPARFARLMRLSGRVLHEADPGSKAIVGGLFGRPLQTPPNIQSGVFLSGLFRARRVKQYFDGVALHPYSPKPARCAPRSKTCAASCGSTTTAPPPSTSPSRLGLRRRAVALGAGALRAGRRAGPGFFDALDQPGELADRRRLVVLLDRSQRGLPVLQLGWPVDRCHEASRPGTSSTPGQVAIPTLPRAQFGGGE